MADEIVSLADILTIEEMRALMDCDLSPEIIIETFLEHPDIAAMKYEKKENKFYITWADSGISTFRFLLPHKEDA